MSALVSRQRVEEALAVARARAAREPLESDVSDFSDEFCQGYLRGQVNAIDFLARHLDDGGEEDSDAG